MKKFHLFLVMLVLVLASLPSARAEDSPKAKVDLGRNAALLYWVAFDQYDAAVKGESFAKAINEYEQVAIDAKLLAALKDSTTLTTFRMAAKMEACDWGTGTMLAEQGPHTLMPHLQRCRQMARLGLLSARANLINKKGDAAVEDLLAVHALARHSQSGGVIISFLVGISIESMVNQFVANHLALFDDQSLRSLADQLRKSPAMLTSRDSILAEREGFGPWIRREVVKLKDRSRREKLLALLQDDEQGKQLAQLIEKNPEEVAVMVDDMLKLYSELAGTCDLPIGEARKAQAEWSKRIADTTNVVAKMLMPAFARVDETYRRSLTMNALVHAVITLRLDGRAAFDAIKDPHGDGPFTIKSTDEGIEVSSKFDSQHKQPAVLKVKWKPAP